MSERTLLGVLRTPPEYWGDQSAIDHTERYIRCVEAANHIEHQSRELDALRARVATAEAGFVKACEVVTRAEARIAELEAALDACLPFMTHKWLTCGGADQACECGMTQARFNARQELDERAASNKSLQRKEDV